MASALRHYRSVRGRIRGAAHCSAPANAFSVRSNDEFYVIGRQSGVEAGTGKGLGGFLSGFIGAEGGMNATRFSRSRWTCRRSNGVCRRGGPHRRGRVRRLALRRAGRAPPDHACRPAGAFCDALDSEHVAARRADRRRHSKGAAGLRGRYVRQRAQHASRHSRRAERRHLRSGNRSGAAARLSPGGSWSRSGPGERSSPTACSGRMGLLSTPRGRIRALSMLRRRTPSCAFPIAAER